MVSNPIVSILMTAFNRETYILNAIDSVLKQTYKEFELIIVDDCSSDNTVNLVRRKALLDNRIKLFINEVNLGDYSNRNQAASYASGKYLKFLDSDDFLYKNSLQIMVDSMERFPSASYGFSYRKYQINDSPFPKLYSPLEAYTEHFLISGFFYAGPGSSIIKRDVFLKVGGFSGKRFVGDYELWLKLSISFDCIVFQPSLIWWRIHDLQENFFSSNSHFHINLLSNFLLSMEYLGNEFCPLNTIQKKISIQTQKTLFCRNLIILLIFKLKPLVFLDLFKRSKINYFDFIKSLFPLRLRLQNLTR
ncbi:MAG: glycosyltransferase family 2 protein [Bacteroidetes bacterium]|nr:glycosyltransferase family 2 protein [Bacteroidota bacterium]